MKLLPLTLILTGCLQQNNPKTEMLDICEMAKSKSDLVSTGLTERQFEFNQQIQPIMKSTEVNNIFQAVASADADQKRELLLQGLRDLKIDQMDCEDLVKMFP